MSRGSQDGLPSIGHRANTPSIHLAGRHGSRGTAAAKTTLDHCRTGLLWTGFGRRDAAAGIVWSSLRRAPRPAATRSGWRAATFVARTFARSFCTQRPPREIMAPLTSLKLLPEKICPALGLTRLGSTGRFRRDEVRDRSSEILSCSVPVCMNEAQETRYQQEESDQESHRSDHATMQKAWLDESRQARLCPAIGGMPPAPFLTRARAQHARPTKAFLTVRTESGTPRDRFCQSGHTVSSYRNRRSPEYRTGGG